MSHVSISKLKEFAGQEVTIKGWLYNKRSSGKLLFMILRDGSGFVQGVIFKKDVPEELFDACSKLGQESSLVVKGEVREDERAPGGVELSIKDVEIIQDAKDFPIAIQEDVPGVDFLMKNRHLWMRSPKPNATIRIRSTIIKAIRDFFDDREFVMVDTPIFTPAACEGTSTLFEVKYFDEKAYLTQSGQLYGEAAAMAFGKIYCFGPTFRAEKSKTRRHLTEFWMVEPEVAFYDLDDVMVLAEDFISYIVEMVLKKNQRELDVLERDTSKLKAIIPPFPRVTYTEAVKIIHDAGLEFTWGEDFGAPHETAIGKNFDKPVMVHRWPREAKAFYMKTDPEDAKLALGVDVLAPEGYGEIIGGAQREDDPEILKQRIKDHNLPEESFEWYLDLRKFGTVPHGGFGLGLERTVAWICGTPHIRECIPFPRMLYKIYP